jgi:hypothetical protein
MTEVQSKTSLQEARILETLAVPVLNPVKGVVPMTIPTTVLAKQRTSETVQTQPFSQ